jgi:hypothetical protein
MGMGESVGNLGSHPGGFGWGREALANPVSQTRPWEEFRNDEAMPTCNRHIVHRHNTWVPELGQCPSFP